MPSKSYKQEESMIVLQHIATPHTAADSNPLHYSNVLLGAFHRSYHKSGWIGIGE